MTVEVKKNGDGFLAKVRGKDNLYAFGFSKAEALRELGHVVEMIVDYEKVRD